MCANGTAALFAHFEGAGCQGKPELKEVEEEMLKTCLDMGDEASSYSFWCTGAITTVPEKDKSPAPGQPGKSSGLWGLLLILAFVFLFLVLAIVGVVQRFTRMGEGFLVSGLVLNIVLFIGIITNCINRSSSIGFSSVRMERSNFKLRETVSYRTLYMAILYI
jgi:hypothetical protein